MKMTGNTILITGGGSGIGRGLAEAFHELGNHIVIAGRRQAALDETTQANPGMRSVLFDVANAGAIAAFAGRMERDFPALNVLINNAGIMREENLRKPASLDDAEAIVATNLLGPLRLIATLLPLLRKQAQSTVLNVSSGLAFVPMAATPTYCATKAAMHSYSQSLRYQLQGTATQVIELIPPYVATDLMGDADPARAMPLTDFISEVMAILKQQPATDEICVERVKPLRFAAAGNQYTQMFTSMNNAMAAAHS